MSQAQDNSNDPLHAKKKAWSGRFSEPVDAFVLRYTASVDFDKRMALVDIEGSLAHAAMLTKIGVISEKDLEDIRRGMTQIREEILAGTFEWQLELEDVHLNIEARLTALIGDAGKRLHTGRSRNDQVATDIRLYLRGEIDEIVNRIEHLQEVLVAQAGKHWNTIMPGFTHMQVAQPVTFGHHMLAYTEMLERDRQRFLDLRRRVNTSPLGAAALAGTTYPIDREYSAKLLGFEAVAQNSLDAVSDRDFAIEFCSAASIIMMHISRLSEELVVWMSQRFGFIKLPDRFTTGSSIMPQKKNPDVPETARGKSGRVYGDLIAMLKRHERVTGLFWWFMEANEHGLDWNTERVTDAWYNASLFDNHTGHATSALSLLKDFLERGSTDMAQVETLQSQNKNNHWYTLDGKRLPSAPTTKGLYIHNGNKVMR